MTETAVSRLADIEKGSRARTVRVVRVIDETPTARSVVFEPSPEEAAEFGYQSGQFVTVRVPDVGSGRARCYSLASSPACERELKFTVKRVEGGHGSNWICDAVVPGMELEVLPPGGTFRLASLAESVILVAGGSGITPLISIAKTMLHGGTGDVLLVYANRDDRSVIFTEELRALAVQFPDRFTVVHLLESLQGYPTPQGLSALLAPLTDRTLYLCGPAPLMDLAADVAASLGFPRDRVHAERFVSLHGDPFAADDDQLSPDDEEPAATVAVELDGESHTVNWPARRKLLDALLAAGLDAPYSCREGACSACVCTLKQGEVTMAHNEILTEEDLADGYILACQAEPVSESIAIEY